jgi:DNA-binding NtrC family response regulator
MPRRILVTWVGHTDLHAWKENGNLSEAQRKAVTEIVRSIKHEGVGPIKSLLNQEAFDKVHLLGNYDVQFLQGFSKWLGGKVTCHPVILESPLDHGEIYKVVDPVLAKLELTAADKLFFHLSPGTPSMAAIWVLLGKSKYPASFFQTHYRKEEKQSVVFPTEIPFDISLDYLPQLLREPNRLISQLQGQSPKEIQGFESIIGVSPSMREVVERARRAAIYDVSVLILGESGTGKEMIAEALHRASLRLDKKFFSINCAAISKTLIESELFGYKKGAFTDAKKDHIGLFKQADGGTLFLDEVGECDLDLQAKLLRALQPPHDKPPTYRTFRPLGSSTDDSADVRIVAATNRDLLKMVQQGSFREDLYYRIATITVQLPPLRQRGNDAILIAESLLNRINEDFQSLRLKQAYAPKALTADARSFIRKHDWPGNVRELKNVLTQCAVMSNERTICSADMSAALSQTLTVRDAAVDPIHTIPDGFNLDDYLDQIRKNYLEAAMLQSQGVKTRAAELLGYGSHQVLTNQLKRFGLDRGKR